VVALRLRQWWGSWRLLIPAAGLALLTMTPGAGSSVPAFTSAARPDSAAVTVSPGLTRVSAVALAAISADRPGTTLSAAAPAYATADSVISGDSHARFAPSAVLAGHGRASAPSPRTAVARDDVITLTGSAPTPGGSRAPPLHVA
jgi:hypothetical protein